MSGKIRILFSSISRPTQSYLEGKADEALHDLYDVKRTIENQYADSGVCHEYAKRLDGDGGVPPDQQLYGPLASYKDWAVTAGTTPSVAMITRWLIWLANMLSQKLRNSDVANGTTLVVKAAYAILALACIGLLRFVAANKLVNATPGGM